MLKNNTITFALFGLILLIFVLFFAAQSSVFPKGEPITGCLNQIIACAQQDKWEEAEKSLNELMKAWEKGRYLLSINYAEADFSLFMDNITKMQGAIQTKDRTETVCQALSTIELWQNFNKVIPEP